MGMDVHGKDPAGESGEYFRRTVWTWHPLWDYCCAVAPALGARVKYGHSNDGDGLDAAHSLALSGLIRRELKSGATDRYLAARDAAVAAMPDEECPICAGTGKRKRAPDSGAGRFGCNGCGGRYEEGGFGEPGTGRIRPGATHYRLERADVEEFAAFLEECGGFEIW